MYEIVLVLVVTIVFINLLLLKAYNKIENEKEIITNELKISIVIPFKNEEINIPALLKSLGSLNYNQDNFEVVFVNDFSTDKSLELILQFKQKNVRIINLTEKHLPGKKGALEIGIKNTSYDIIALTDADCIIEKNWLKSISKKFYQGYDLVFGYSPFLDGNSLISKFSSYENLKNYIIYFLFTQLGIPFSATSRNLAFTKSTYNQVSGYSNTIETLSGDDDLFIRELIKKKFKIGFFLDKESNVYSYPASTFKEYILRKSRHLKTSHHYLLRHKILLGCWYTINLFALFSFFLITFSKIFILPSLIKLIFDINLIFTIKKKIPHNFKLLDIALLEFLYQIFVVINFINSFLLSDKWKENK